MLTRQGRGLAVKGHTQHTTFKSPREKASLVCIVCRLSCHMLNPSHTGGGCWHPDAQPLVAMRRSIDRHPDRLRTVLMEPQMRKEFLANASKKDADVINAFISSRSNAESALKTKPKGFDADHKDILLLRLRSFTIGRKLTDEEVLGPHFLERVAELFRIMCPFVSLSHASGKHY